MLIKLFDIIKTLINYLLGKEKDTPEPPVKTQLQILQEIYRKHGAEWKELNILGIRDESSPDTYNDLFIVEYKGLLYQYTGTTDPGSFYTKKENAMNPKGCAHLVYGLHVEAFKLGKHYNQVALVAARKLKVWRDTNGNYIDDDNCLDMATGINLHTTNGQGELVGKWSAGCQVIKRPESLAEVTAMAKMSKQKLFDYLLISRGDAIEAGLLI